MYSSFESIFSITVARLVQNYTKLFFLQFLFEYTFYRNKIIRDKENQKSTIFSKFQIVLIITRNANYR